MWKAILKQVAENQTPSDDIEIAVLFENETGKSMTKSYQLKSAGITSLQDVKNTIQYELDRLNKFDEVREILLTKVDCEINSDEIKDIKPQ